MMRLLMLFTALVLALAATTAFSQIVINEVCWDDPSTDNEEFIELYNAGGSAVDITGYQIEGLTGSTGAVYATHTVGTFTLAAGDYHVIGQSTACPNSDEITNAATDWQNGYPDAFLLLDSGAAVIDALGYEMWNGPGALPADAYEGTTGFNPGVVGMGWAATDFSCLRIPDGQDTDDNELDFAIGGCSPGAANMKTYAAYSDNYDGYAVGTGIADWWGVYVDATVINPASTESTNPNVIAVSPQGGNALIQWDSSGGGDVTVYTPWNHTDISFECYWYLESTLPTTLADEEGGGIWLRSAVDTYHGRRCWGGAADSDCVGVAFFVERDGDSVEARFFERIDQVMTNYGPLIDVTAPGNDGWQRVRIDVNADGVSCFFGGTYGDTASPYAQGFCQRVGGGATLGFREALVANAECRPPTIDDVAMNNAPVAVPVELSIFATD